MTGFAILGSGFGLYGYLPALVSCGQRIILPERYQARFHSRTELAPFAAHIEWQADEHSALERASGVLLSLPPTQQGDWLPICLAKKNITHLLLEKPLACSPLAASALLSQLDQAKKSFRIGYIFRHTPWGNYLLSQIKNQPSHLTIKWQFMAHHFRHDLQTWKRSHTTGGGVLRFYGIHLIALLAELGYDQVTYSRLSGAAEDECDHWEARFTGHALPHCHLSIATRSDTHLFQIASAHEALFDLKDPFDLNDSSTPLDKRVPLLSELCHSLFHSADTYPDWYAQATTLWAAIEKQTSYEEVVYAKKN